MDTEAAQGAIRPGDLVLLQYDKPPTDVWLTFVCLGASDTWVFAHANGAQVYINPTNANMRWMRKATPAELAMRATERGKSPIAASGQQRLEALEERLIGYARHRTVWWAGKRPVHYYDCGSEYGCARVYYDGGVFDYDGVPPGWTVEWITIEECPIPE